MWLELFFCLLLCRKYHNYTILYQCVKLLWIIPKSTVRTNATDDTRTQFVNNTPKPSADTLGTLISGIDAVGVHNRYQYIRYWRANTSSGTKYYDVQRHGMGKIPVIPPILIIVCNTSCARDSICVELWNCAEPQK